MSLIGAAFRPAPSTRADTTPAAQEQRRSWLHHLACQATVYGLPAVWQHALMRRQTWGPDGAPLSTFTHERRLAAPDFSAFRVPNVDTLYSSAWVDLTAGPVDLVLPDFGDRYFTLQLLDAFSNSSNISRRTVGDARRVTIVPPGVEPSPSPSADVAVPADSPVLWVLMRIQVWGDDVGTVHGLQDQVALLPQASTSRLVPEAQSGDVETDWRAFFSTLDAALRLQGHPVAEAGLVAQLRALGLLGEVPFDAVTLDDAARQAMEGGYREALELVGANRARLGTATDAGWTQVRDKGRHGHNYLSRAIMNFVGLGANVEEENTSFNTYVDHRGDPLQGTRTYELSMEDPPDTDAFWSVTLYEAESGMLYDAPGGRYSVGSASGGRVSAATGRIVVGPEAADGAAWLPTPTSAFFLVLRIYSPGAEVLAGGWTPPPLREVTPTGTAAV